MSTYAQTAPARRAGSGGGTDVAAWALVAVIVAIVCAIAGWAIARQSNPGADDLRRSSYLAAQGGSLQGQQDGYRAGAVAGRTEAGLRAKQQSAMARAEATREGYAAGYDEGRNRAMARADGDSHIGTSSALGAGGAYPAPDYRDILASGAFADVPGYADSAYSSSGFGSTATSPYAGGTGFGASSYGDVGF